ncbi:MAG TPA: A/G-specific adenine glycosylase, partial [Candidatus Saccharibacteria bacterium]|nr:A/G-specific adenine glycosylase [Candidatus Saccharibacteria bacterium]
METSQFKQLIRQKGEELYRDMPWRQNTDAYYVLVSEVMLQQTQVDRVVPKFEAFINAFPTAWALAEASLAEVLQRWSGLGYNRRAKFLHEAAKMVVSEYDGQIPAEYTQLMRLPGVGKNTAGALLVYAFNRPAVFIETNIRTVYFYHFFERVTNVTDKEIEALLEATLDKHNPRTFYWALMDYGAWLKKQGLGLLDKSKHYKKQAPLKGSLREVRGLILKLLVKGPLQEEELAHQLPQDDRFQKALDS